MANSDEAQIGEWVLAVGNPMNLTSTVTAGDHQRQRPRHQYHRRGDAIESFIQTDAAVNPGNSGGALVDAQGRLLGINTAISTQTGFFEGYSFAIPSNIVTKIADDIIEFGTYQRAYLGVGISELDDDYAKELGLNFSRRRGRIGGGRRLRLNTPACCPKTSSSASRQADQVSARIAGNR
ncbi:MAG: trypsin-like peptidase domain-containing protein [Saprospirales bacterium]|nr:trypsin-like peptidase domain-containing protein [Saprospirales bacterium]